MARVSKIIHGLLLLGVAGIFLYAGALKAADPSGFAVEVEHYHLIPWGPAVATALYLPWLEIISGGLLLVGAWRKAALSMLLLLMLVFLGALGSAWFRGIDLRCGCFGSSEGGSTVPVAILRDLGILAALLYLLAKERCRGGCVNRLF